MLNFFFAVITSAGDFHWFTLGPHARMQSFEDKMEMAYADLSETMTLLLLPATMYWDCISDAFTGTSR